MFFPGPGVAHDSKAGNACPQLQHVGKKRIRIGPKSDFELSGGAVGPAFRGTLAILNPFMPAYACQERQKTSNWYQPVFALKHSRGSKLGHRLTYQIVGDLT